MRIHTKNNTARARSWVDPLARPFVAFARSRKSGAMFIGGSLAMLAMASVGGMLSNYGWREAQEEEIDAALRAGVSASAHFMRGNLAAAEDQIKERVADFMRGLLGDVTIAKDDIVIDHDFSTNRTTIKVEGNAEYAFKNLWAAGRTGDPESLTGEQVVVEFDASQFEFALALDISKSMGDKPTGWSVTRLDALKDAISTIAQTVDDLSKTNPGIATVSLVPYSNVVHVADTSGSQQTDAKERYVRMLTGAEYSTQTSRDTDGHWVDTFHSYGTGDDMGPLASRDLPDFLTATDWNLRRRGETAYISSQAPDLGIWTTRGEDFWNGCVMARWGAYWDPDARDVIWDPANPDNWPARKTVAGWAPGSTSIHDLPLHLSDAPPDARKPNTRFTAYSWPDARIGGFADHWLNEAMRLTLEPGYSPLRYDATSENHWHLRSADRGGSLLCPEAFIVPLTDDVTALRASDNYDVVQLHSATYFGQTFLHLGVVWGLRTLSPLWRDVWNTKSVSGDDLPRTPCLAGGTTQGCSQFVQKAIVIVSDGANVFGYPRRGRSFGFFDPAKPMIRNPSFTYGRCHSTFNAPANSVFRSAIAAEDPATFANNFDIDPSGVFTPAGMSAVLDGFQAFHPKLSALDPMIPSDQVVIDAYRIVWENALKDITPWQLFRGYDDNSPTKATDAIDVLVDPANRFDPKGRPVQNGHYCRPHAPFSAYGRPEELVSIGDGPPVADVAPFSIPSWLTSSPTADLQTPVTDRLDDWFLEACDIAGQRGVRIHAVYIGGDQRPYEQRAIALLEDCVDRGYGGNPVIDEVHATPTAQELKNAIEDIMDIKRTLRFIDP